MHIIPVIDLKSGEVVRARRGLRHLYPPLETPLAPTCRPADVVAGFLALHAFPEIYVADLDAIEGRNSHGELISALEMIFPRVTFWIDAGIANEDAARACLARHRGHIVLGSETLREAETLSVLRTHPRIILSLDFRDGIYQGPAALCENEASWPARVIVMSLARVGSDEGPDLDRLRAIVAIAKDGQAIYAAGGLRGAQDLAALADIGVTGILAASALHDGRLDANTLAQHR